MWHGRVMHWRRTHPTTLRWSSLSSASGKEGGGNFSCARLQRVLNAFWHLQCRGDAIANPF